MKTKILFMIIAVLAMYTLTTCEDIIDVKFSYSTADMVFQYGPDTITGDLTFFQDNVANKLDSIAVANGTSISKLKSAKLKTCTITITDPADSNFNMVSSFEAFLKADTLPQIPLAVLNPVPRDTNSVQLTVYSQELEKYFKASFFNFILRGTKDAPLGTKYTVKVHLEFDAVAEGI